MNKQQLLYNKVIKDIFMEIKENYPFANKKEFLSFNNKFINFQKKVLLLKNDQDFFIAIEKFLASLKNSHTKLLDYPGKVYYKPKKCQVVLCENRFFLSKNNKVVGEIIKIDNFSPWQIVKERIKRISGGNQNFLYNEALKFILASETDKPVKILLKIRRNFKTIVLKRDLIKFIPWKRNVLKKIINSKVGYLKVMAWINDEKNKKEIDQTVKYFLKHKIKSLIIDVRGNGGGNANMAKYLAGYFFEKKVLVGLTKNRVNKKSFKLKVDKLFVEPLEPYLSAPIILLIDGKCLSSNEYFIAGLGDNKRAFLIGETTGGGSGNPKFINIPFRDSILKISIATWQYYRINGQKLEGRGIRPDLFVKKNVKDLLSNKDMILEVGIKKAKA